MREIKAIRTFYGWTVRDMARVLNVANGTIYRWENGDFVPEGCAKEVLQALYNVAQHFKDDEQERQRIAGLVSMGIGAMIFILLTRKVTT